MLSLTVGWLVQEVKMDEDEAEEGEMRSEDDAEEAAGDRPVKDGEKTSAEASSPQTKTVGEWTRVRV